MSEWVCCACGEEVDRYASAVVAGAGQIAHTGCYQARVVIAALKARAERAEAALVVYQNTVHGPGCAFMALKYEGRIEQAERRARDLAKMLRRLSGLAWDTDWDYNALCRGDYDDFKAEIESALSTEPARPTPTKEGS